MNDSDNNGIWQVIVDCCYRIHERLGPGLGKPVYLESLARELRKKGLICETDVSIPARREDVNLYLGFRTDLIVENQVIVELREKEKIRAVHKKLLMTYLGLTGMKLGLLVNFNLDLIGEGIERIVNGL